MPELVERQDVEYLRDHLLLGASESEVRSNHQCTLCLRAVCFGQCTNFECGMLICALGGKGVQKGNQEELTEHIATCWYVQSRAFS